MVQIAQNVGYTLQSWSYRLFKVYFKSAKNKMENTCHLWEHVDHETCSRLSTEKEGKKP